MTHPNELHDGVANLASKAFTPMHMRNHPKSFTAHAMRGGNAKAKSKGAPPKGGGDLKGDLLIRELWTQETDSIHNMRVVNTDDVYHQPPNPEKFL